MKCLECKGSGLPTRKHSDLADKCEDCNGTGKTMTVLEKAVSQEHLTEDTVEAQFCSDWLKDEIKLLFTEIITLQGDLKDWENDCNQDQQYIESLIKERDMLQTECDNYNDATSRLIDHSNGLAAENARLKEDLACACTRVMMTDPQYVGWGHTGPCPNGCTCDTAKAKSHQSK